jgi:[1-hydroxy-2-(trimethylamino)ethyl]phosphonate dioxygenase
MTPHHEHTMTTTDPIAALAALFERHGDQVYGEAVTQLEHALQCAHAAERDGAPPALITAALLHDVGHMLHDDPGGALQRGIDDRHEVVGATWLTQWFGNDVVRPVALHVVAKRYLCLVDAGYTASLSPVSLRTLALQGGPMRDSEAQSFAATQHAAAAVQVRRWDEVGKLPDLATPDLAHFLAIARGCLRRTSGG